MKELKLAEAIGRSIIKKLHDHSDRASLDDSVYVTILKKILEGIVKELALLNTPKIEISALKKSLKQYAKELYVKASIKNKLENETVEEAEEVGRIYFEYVYKFGRHPE
jgi:hypothetical protein